MDKYDEILDELTKLKIFDPEEYMRRLRILKAKDPTLYNRLIEPLGIDDSKVIPLLIKENEKKKEDNGKGIGIAIIATSLAGIVVISIILFFLLNTPVKREELGPKESIEIGYRLFNNLNKTYLAYQSQINISSNSLGTKSYNIKEYYLRDEQLLGAILINSTTKIFIDRLGDIELCKGGTQSIVEEYNVAEIYDEIIDAVENKNVTYSEREDVWEISNIRCAPIVIELENKDEFTHYELCLNNDGIPIAVGKLYKNNAEGYIVLYVSFLESLNDPIIKQTTIDGKELEEWYYSCSNH